MSVAATVRPIRVLLVEDNPGDARLIIEMLQGVERHLFDMQRVDRLDEALDRLDHAAVDVVLLDLGLPDSVGLATFETTRQHAPQEPIVVISGLDDERLALDAVRAGAQDYLVKGRIEGQLLGRVIRYAIERKRAEEELRNSEAYYRSILENIVDAVFVTDQTGRYLDVNPRACELLGYTREELLGLSSADTYPTANRDEAAERIKEIIAGQPRTFERQGRRKDGTEFLAEVSARVLPDGRLLATARDITERRHLENQLRQAQKMEAVGRLAGGVAHDFNNVLTAVFGYIDLLREELPANSGAQEDLAEVRRAAERAASLTKQLLAFSRQQVLEPVVLDLNLLIIDFEKMLGRVIGEDIELRLALKDDTGNVRADIGQLQQVIMNLVVNARDAMPKGGKIILETANTDLTEQYAELHQPVAPGSYVMLAVSDTGCGMTPEVKARIFEPFFTTKEKGKGTGLGLSTVYGIVKQSGGYIWAYSEVNSGTTFKIYLPRVDAPAEQRRKPKETKSVTGTETVLLAEDDAILRPLAIELLERLGYTVLAAEDSATALAAAGAHNGKIDLLIADVVLPGPSGRELAKLLDRNASRHEGALRLGLHRRRHRSPWHARSRTRVPAEAVHPRRLGAQDSRGPRQTMKD